METGRPNLGLDSGQGQQEHNEPALSMQSLKRDHETMKQGAIIQETNIEPPYEGRSFTFLIGQDKNEFTLNVAAVAAKSLVLDRMMNGGMSEAKEGRAFLPDVDRETFTEFARFCYEKDYHVRNTLKSPFLQDAREIISRYASGSLHCAHCNKKTSGSSLKFLPFCSDDCVSLSKSGGNKICPCCVAIATPKWEICVACKKNKSVHRFTMSKIPSTDPGTINQLDRLLRHAGISQEFLYETISSDVNAETLMRQAKLIVLADTYNVQELGSIEIVRLAYDLSKFELTPKTAQGFVELAEYVYEHTRDGEVPDADNTNIAKKVLMDFAATHIDKLVGSKEWRDFMADGGDPVSDLMNAFSFRMSA